MRFISIALVSIAVGGCATHAARPVVPLSASFDTSQAAMMLQDGTNTIRGNAFLRQRGGGVVTCAGSEVTLIPATNYAKQRIAAIYQGSSVISVGQMRARPTFDPDPSEYHSNTKKARCDAQGNFVFERVADGDFFVTTIVHWQVGYANQGGGIIDRLQVRGGETKSVVLTGN